MDALDLHKFVNDNKLEYHWYKDEVILFVPTYLIKSFSDLLGYTFLSNKEIRPVMKEDYFCIFMEEICDYFDISLHVIFETENP